MKRLLFCIVATWLSGWVHSSGADPAPRTNAPTVLLVVGAPGEPEFATNFIYQARVWASAAERGGARQHHIGLDAATTDDDLAQFRRALDAEDKESQSELWIVLIGHGTFDGHEARFNLRGPDLSATDVAEWLKPFRRPLVFVNTASASAPFLNKLKGTNRIVAVSTRSGFEQNFARFGKFLAESIADPEGDLDQDGQTSFLEAFLRASHRVDEYYKNEGRLATEHPLIDDNGDGQGTPADWFRGTRATKKPKEGAAVDGAKARQRHLVQSAEELTLAPEVRARRDSLELEIESLRDLRATLKEDDYYDRLEKILLELARLRTGASGFQ